MHNGLSCWTCSKGFEDSDSMEIEFKIPKEKLVFIRRSVKRKKKLATLESLHYCGNSFHKKCWKIEMLEVIK